MSRSRGVTAALAVVLTALLLGPRAQATSVLSRQITPPNHGYLCSLPQSSSSNDVFLHFSSQGTQISGYEIAAWVSTIAHIPMTGQIHGDRVKLLPISGYGAYQGHLAHGRLLLDQTSGVVPPLPMHCAMASRHRWRLETKAEDVGPQINTPDLLARYQFAYADWASQNGQTTVVNYVHPEGRLLKKLDSDRVSVFWPGTSRAFVQPAYRLHFSSGPVSRPHDISVAVSRNGHLLLLADRSTDGRCLYWISDSHNGWRSPNVPFLPSRIRSLGVMATPVGTREGACLARLVATRDLEPIGN